MKLALISIQEDKDRVPPLGLIYLATYLDKKVVSERIQTRIFDANFQKNIIDEVINFKPDLIGLSAMTVQYSDVINFAREIKKHYSAPILLGGVHISSLPESLDMIFDIGIVGEGEETLRELVELYLKKKEFRKDDIKKIKGIVFYDKNTLVKTDVREPLHNLDDIPMPDFGYIDKLYFTPREDLSIGKMCILGHIITSRGCPYRCVFCSTSRFWKTLRFHSPEYVAKNIKYQIDNFGVNHIHVLDDLFTVSKERLKNLIEAFKHEGILGKVSFSCQPRANLIDEDMCKLMKEINIKSVNFGFESGSQKMLNYLKAGTVTTEMNRNAILLCKKYGFSVFGSLIFGSPEETAEDMKETLDFMDWSKKQKVDFIWTLVATPFPATPWWDEALKRGEVKNDMDWSKLSHHAIKEVMLTDIDKEQFREIFKSSRKKSREFKYNLIINFVKKYPVFAVTLFFREPVYYMNKLLLKVFKY
jgi:radical SAM superfamily enzyme YgiQ (UPF0313 family)